MVGKDRRHGVLSASAGAAVSLAALAIILANLHHFELGGQIRELGPVASAIAEVLVYFLMIMAVVLIGLIMRTSRRRLVQKKEEQSSPGQRMPLLVAVGVVIILAVLIGLTYGSVLEKDSDGNGDGEVTPSQDPPLTPQRVGGVAAMTGILLAVLALAAFAALRFVHGRSAVGVLGMPLDEISPTNGMIAKAISELQRGDDPRSVILRAYQQMSRVLASKLDNASCLTPAEVAEAAINRYGWPAGPTQELTGLFEEAYYSDHALAEGTRERALGCLAAILSFSKGASGRSRGRGYHADL